MINMLPEKTTILVKRETRNKLARLGTKDSTFDQIINELLGELN